jgi:serine/threonine-protein kinase
MIYYDMFATGALRKVPASGGTPQQVTTLDPKKQEIGHHFPEMLPDGRTMLLTVRTGEEPSFDEAEIQALSLTSGERKTLIKGGTNAHFVASGHLVFFRAGVLMAVGFDPGNLEVKGSPVPVLEHVAENPRAGAGQMSVSRDGAIVYVSGGTSIGDHELVFVDKATGAARALTAKRRPYEDFTLSPDGRMIAATIEGPVTDVWLHHIARDLDTRFTIGVENRDPIWSADGKILAYNTYKNGKWCIVTKPVEGGDKEEVLLSNENPIAGLGWTPDRRFFLYMQTTPDTSNDILMLPMDGDPKPRPILNTSSDEEWASLSPDGHWLAYTSDESGQLEVYVIPFPGDPSVGGGKLRISTDGGERPHWAPNSRELYYYVQAARVAAGSGKPASSEPITMYAVSIEAKGTLQAGKPHRLFGGPYFGSFHDYAPTPDGRGFIMIRATQGQLGATELSVVLNWFEELKRRVPVTGK